jgi:drug/metabolite transporter (DMT)-like permease
MTTEPSQHDAGTVRRAMLALACGAAVVSLAPILVKAASLQGLGPTAIAFWRCLLGALLIAVVVALFRFRVAVTRDVTGLLVLAGLAFALDLFTWHRSIVLAGAGLSTILANTQVFGTALLSAVFFKEKLRPRLLLLALAAMVGVTLLAGAGSDVSFTLDYVRGIVYGLASGALYSVFLVSLRAAGRRSPQISALGPLLWLSSYAALFLLIAVAAEGEPFVPRGWMAWGFVAALAVVAQVLGWWTISRSLPRIRGAVGGLILLLQPALATIWGALIFGERLEPLQILGVLITLGAVYLGSVSS